MPLRIGDFCKYMQMLKICWKTLGNAKYVAFSHSGSATTWLQHGHILFVFAQMLGNTVAESHTSNSSSISAKSVHMQSRGNQHHSQRIQMSERTISESLVQKFDVTRIGECHMDTCRLINRATVLSVFAASTLLTHTIFADDLRDAAPGDSYIAVWGTQNTERAFMQ